VVLEGHPDGVKSNGETMNKTRLISAAVVVGGIVLYLGLMGVLAYQRYLESIDPVKSINSVDQFEQVVLKSDLPVFVFFYGRNCQSCQSQHPLIERAAADYAGKVKFVKVDVYRVPQIPRAIGITRIPTMLVIKVKDRTIVGYQGFLDAGNLKRLIEKGIAAQPQNAPAGAGAQPAAPAGHAIEL